jgi:uncharacterized protein (DUF934 family)
MIPIDEATALPVAGWMMAARVRSQVAPLPPCLRPGNAAMRQCGNYDAHNLLQCRIPAAETGRPYAAARTLIPRKSIFARCITRDVRDLGHALAGRGSTKSASA